MQTADASDQAILISAQDAFVLFPRRHAAVLCRLQHASFTEPMPDDEDGDRVFALRRAIPCGEGRGGERIGRLTLMSHILVVTTATQADADILHGQVESLLRGLAFFEHRDEIRELPCSCGECPSMAAPTWA